MRLRISIRGSVCRSVRLSSRFRQNSWKSQFLHESLLQPIRNAEKWFINHATPKKHQLNKYEYCVGFKYDKNKASWPTMRPQACMIIICIAFWVLHGWLFISQRFLLVVVEIRDEMRDFQLFWRKRDGPTDRRTDGPTDTPSTHLKTILTNLIQFKYVFTTYFSRLTLFVTSAYFPFSGATFKKEEASWAYWPCFSMFIIICVTFCMVD